MSLEASGELPQMAQVQILSMALKYDARLKLLQERLGDTMGGRSPAFLRRTLLPHGRFIEVQGADGKVRKLRMFGSNNYLGLANHPYVAEQVKKAIDTYGVGAGGTPLFYGYHHLVRTLEERFAAFMGTEAVALFSNGAYGANLGVLTSLVDRKCVVLYDEQMHTSFVDGVKICGATGLKFAHNDPDALRELFDDPIVAEAKDVFVGVEGIYSMEGDLGLLEEIAPLCAERGAHLIVDDAHAIGVIGEHGAGTVEHFGVRDKVTATVGSFAKTFGVQGGFVAASRLAIDYIRVFAHTYVFAVTLPVPTAAAVLAGLDLLEREPERMQRLHDNIEYALTGLDRLGIEAFSHSPLIRLHIREGASITKSCAQFAEHGIFINPIMFPAVPITEQGFRINITAEHTREDIDALMEAIEKVWMSNQRDPRY